MCYAVYRTVFQQLVSAEVMIISVPVTKDIYKNWVIYISRQLRREVLEDKNDQTRKPSVAQYIRFLPQYAVLHERHARGRFYEPLSRDNTTWSHLPFIRPLTTSLFSSAEEVAGHR